VELAQAESDELRKRLVEKKEESEELKRKLRTQIESMSGHLEDNLQANMKF